MNKFVLAAFLIVIALARTLAGVRAASIVTLTVNLNQSNPQYPYNAYSSVTLNETLAYNNLIVTTYPSDGLVGLQIQDPNGNTMVIRTLSTGGTVPYPIAASVSQAYLSNGQEHQISSISIPSQSNPVIPLVYFSVTNNLDTMQSMLVTINVYDSNGVPIGEASQEMSNVAAKSSSAALVDFPIASFAHYGTAYACVDIYNTWPSQGGVPLAVEKSFQFTVTGGTPFQGTPSSTNSLNGPPFKNFNLTFTLPNQDCPVGTYTAYSSTNYSGVSASQTTTFSVSFLDDLNGDGRVNFNDVSTFVSMYIAYYSSSHTYNPAIDFDHNGRINMNDVDLFVHNYIEYWSS